MRELGMTLPGLQARAAAIGQLPALGLLTLAGLQPSHWSCTYRENPIGCNDAAIDAIRTDRPDLVAVSALTASVEEAYRLSHRLRSAGLRTILGGLHATACPEEALAHFDSVVCGEGEPVWPTVLADVETGRLQRLYRPTHQFSLADAPVPRFDLLGTAPRPRFTMQTQRGCPLACEFCGASRLLGAFREKPAVNLVREVRRIAEIESRPLLEFADDNTFAGQRDLTPLLQELADCEARWFTETDWRFGENPDRVKEIAVAGCVQVLVGFESMVHRHAGMGSKQRDWPRMLEAILAIQEAGVAVIGRFIVGCDGETRESLDELAAFLLNSPLADVQITVQTPFAGTALYERLRQERRLLPERGWDHYTLCDLTYRPTPLIVGELEAGFRGLVRAVFAAEPTRRRQALRRNIWAKNPRLRPWAS